MKKIIAYQSSVATIIFVQLISTFIFMQYYFTMHSSRGNFSNSYTIEHRTGPDELQLSTSSGSNSSNYLDEESDIFTGLIQDPYHINPLESNLRIFPTIIKISRNYRVLLNESCWSECQVRNKIFWPNTLVSDDYTHEAPSIQPHIRHIDEEINKMTRYNNNTFKANFSTEFNANINAYEAEWKESLALAHELAGMLEGFVPCRKLMAMGGRSMHRMPDGEKYICLDPALAPEPYKCLVYSFGVGHDFTFERMMGLYGCEVFAFDDDFVHVDYPVEPYNRVTFTRLRLSDGMVKLVSQDHRFPNGTTGEYQYLYRPLDNILYLMNHEHAVIDYLKLDIEGAEWSVFSDSIFKLDVLNRTKFLAVEIHFYHLENTNDIKSPVQLRNILTKYQSFFSELKSRGFALLYQEPNYVGPRYVTVGGAPLPVFAELVWLNQRIPPANKLYPSRPREAFANRLEAVRLK